MTQFSESDLNQITSHGLTIETINQQLADFKTGFPYARIVAPAVINSGIQSTPDAQYGKYYRDHRNEYKIVKFVPASGAATRMFKDLYTFMDTGEKNSTVITVLNNLEQFAFYDKLKQYLPQKPSDKQIIQYLLTADGLNYGKLPKALLAFHKYDTFNRTALEEHLVEGALYAQSNNTVNIHFTVSPEHKYGFEELLARVLPEYEQKFGVKYNITMSAQMPQTDTIAVNMDNTPFRTNDGKLLFRPAGHGALIENLNNIDADIIFIKNIDNICPDNARAETVYNKELLAGLAIKTQQKIFQYIKALDTGNANINEISEFINTTLGIHIDVKDAAIARKILNRPLRICAMIKNTGAAGGGPFWVKDSRGTESLQIMESAQIAPEQMDILKNGEYFNPVDLVCMPRDWRGNKFNLNEYIDSRTGFISEKSAGGRTLRAMERPGLWNGAMAHWNTIFVAVPLATFTPVKVVSDLILQAHKTR